MGGPSMDYPQEQMIQDIPQAEMVVAHVEVPSTIEEAGQMTPMQWFSTASWIVGALVITACFVRFTPFSKGVSDLFMTLANLAKKETPTKGKK